MIYPVSPFVIADSYRPVGHASWTAGHVAANVELPTTLAKEFTTSRLHVNPTTSPRRHADKTVYRRGFARVNSLTDAVVAIAMTLLIFPLTNLAANMGSENVVTLFRHDWPKFLGFLLGFIVIAKLWVDNHQLFRDLEGYTAALVYAQLVWLLSIVVIPFTTNVLSSSSSTGSTDDGFYISALFVANAATLVQYRLIDATPAMGVAGFPMRHGVLTASMDTAASGLALLLAFLVPGVGVYPLLLMIPSGFAGRHLVRHLQQADSTRKTRP